MRNTDQRNTDSRNSYLRELYFSMAELSINFGRVNCCGRLAKDLYDTAQAIKVILAESNLQDAAELSAA
jgi:hypothetical protein